MPGLEKDDSQAHPPSDWITLEPIALKPIFVERVWGANSLLSWYPSHLTSKPIGEVWLTSEECTAASGEFAGYTLEQLRTRLPKELGDPQHEGFPLLIKLLFPREKLSVQVHPNDEQAQAQGMPRGKTECWYVLQADPGAEVAVGFKEPLSPEAVRASLADGSIEGKLRMIPVEPGDMILVEAGTVHAIGPGMVVLETQQYSDTTYRLWDYGRPRELHTEPGLAVLRTDTKAGPVQPAEEEAFTRLVGSPYFAVDRFRLDGVENIRLTETDKLQILVAIHDDTSVVVNGEHLFALPRAEAVLLPATGGWYALHSEGRAEVIRILQP